MTSSPAERLAAEGAGGRRFEAIGVDARLLADARVRRLLDELAGAGMTISVLAPGSDAQATLSDQWWAHGIRPSEGIVLSDGAAGSGGVGGVLGAAGGVPGVAGGEPARFDATTPSAVAFLRDQLRRRRRRDVPDLPPDSTWIVAVNGVDSSREPARDVRIAMVDPVAGTLGSPLADYAPAHREVFAAGVWQGVGADSTLLRGPDWTRLAGRLDPDRPVRRVLDLRTGLLHHDFDTGLGHVRAVSFASRARPGIGVLRAAGRGAHGPRSGPLRLPSSTAGGATVSIRGAAGGLVAAARDSVAGRGDARRLERVVAIRANAHRLPTEADAAAMLAAAEETGFERLLAAQRDAWAARWAAADIRIEGDDAMQRAIRYALFELMALAPDGGEAPIGARGLSGPKYRGHVFWDTDVFVLPFLAATRPEAARAILEYRVRRLAEARAAAAEQGLAGARLPWESAADGRDVTPDWIVGADGLPLQVLTGKHELHIVADVAWAAATYSDWTGDRAFAAGPGAELLVETARFWASRLERDPDGSVHLSDVIGPDEYHNLVADNAFTNVMARWNLRRAAPLANAAERRSWLGLADRIVDGFDRASGLYEQFRGYFDLEPVKIAELARRPLSGEVFFGRDRVAGTQCVKQPDVLMLYHLIPDEMEPGTLAANLDFYDPRTSFGSSLSPGIHAALMARAGRPDQALEALRMAAFIDLDDDSTSSNEGLHVATMGSLWQAIVLGFAGLRPDADLLTLDPHLPASWSAVEIPFRLRGRTVRVRLEHDRLIVSADRPSPVLVSGAGAVEVGLRPAEFVRSGAGWSATG